MIKKYCLKLKKKFINVKVNLNKNYVIKITKLF